jgi:predicted TIM-barrel fold metal-dependent hydrolase
LRGYNRWLADHCEPGRQIGVSLVPLDDPQNAVAEVGKARELGLGGIYPEWDPSDTTAPALYDEAYDPFWAACADQGLPVCIHSGAGVPSGFYERPSKQGGLLFVFEVQFWARRPIWHLIFGGVLERHPQLRVCWVETWGDWLPRFLQSMDWQWEVWDARLPNGIKEIAPIKPSEYWERQCSIAIATPSVGELDRRNEFPVSTMMYGTDFPHAGSPWGVSNEYLQETVGRSGFNEQEARAFLGENAIRWFNLDRSELEKIAARVGPSPKDILEPMPGSLEKMNPYMQSKVRRPPSV